MEFHKFEEENVDLIDSLIKDRSEMTYSERRFLNGLIRHYKPKKILEVGIAAGSSSVVILNAIRDIEGSKLHSIDYSTPYYRDKTKNSGYLVHECVPELADKWELRTGGLAARFMDEIGGDIDFCFMDTTHHNPGEFLDFLMVLPYLKKDCIFVLHDTAYHLHKPLGITCGTLLSTINGNKIIPHFEERFIPNIGAAILDDTQEHWDYFNLLTLPWAWWTYLGDDGDWDYLKKFFARHYDKDMQRLFDNVVNHKNNKKKEYFQIEADKKEAEKQKLQETGKQNLHEAEKEKEQKIEAARQEAEKRKAHERQLEADNLKKETGLTAKNAVNFMKSFLFFPWYMTLLHKSVLSLSARDNVNYQHEQTTNRQVPHHQLEYV